MKKQPLINQTTIKQKSIEDNSSKSTKISKCKALLKKQHKTLSSYILKHKKTIKKIVIISTIIILLIIAYFLFLKARFSVKEDLVVDIESRHIELNVTSSNLAQLTIPLTIKTTRLCTATCTETLVNVNFNTTIYSQNITFKKIHRANFETVISPQILGEGQDIYVFSISCTNKPTNNCPAPQDSVDRDTIITVNRELTNREQNLKELQEQILTNIYSDYNNGLSNIDETEKIILQLKYTKISDLNNNISSINEQSKQLSNSLNKLNNVWLERNHEITENKIISQNISSSSQEFLNTSFILLNEIKYRISMHNFAVNSSYNLSDEIIQKEKNMQEGNQFITPIQTTLSGNLASAKSLLNFAIKSIEKKDFTSYENLLLVLSNVNSTLANFENTYLKQIENNSAVIRADFDLFYLNENMCYLTNFSNICKQNATNKIFDFTNKSYELTSDKISQFCSDYSNLSEIKNNLSSQRELMRANLTSEQLLTIDNESRRYNIYLLLKNREELLLRNDSSATVAINIIDSYLSILNATSAIEEGLNLNATMQTFNESLLEYALPANFVLQNMTECKYASLTKTIVNLSFETKPQINVSTYNYSFTPLLPQCCFKDKCEPCINDSTINYPIVMVHGHGFYSRNEPKGPSQIYNKLEDKLLEENIAIPAGILTIDEDILYGSLGKINSTITYKAAYYPQDIVNNESISLFADRLNIIINKAKAESGKEKVIIIAHSMGGLVTREYLKNYGSNDVDRVLIIGTPNRGITPETVTFCKLFGRNLECDEMHRNSDFIKNLANETPPQVPVYTIRGIGCPTFGSDGDGIVASDSVPLAYAENFEFEGNCASIGTFHMYLPDPNQNPELYLKIKEILTQ